MYSPTHMMISEGTELFHATSLSSITRGENISEKIIHKNIGEK
jgi:hypothetical protein